MEEKQNPSVPGPSTNKRREEKSRRKDSRSWENVLKTLATITDPAEKIELIGKKYGELYDEMRRATQNCQLIEKHHNILRDEKDHLQTEQAKSILGRSRLESLCRELQKQNKLIKEENMAKLKEEEERRKAVALKFTGKLTDINNMMEETKEKSSKLREENLKMTSKLTELYNEFQQREQDSTKMAHQMDIEKQYNEARLKKMELEMRAEKEIMGRERALIQGNLEKSEANCRILQNTIKGLQEQIDVYKNQYSDFESTMTKSNKVFDTFKYEITTMTKRVASLETETQVWRTKYQNSAKQIIDLSKLKQNHEKAIVTSEKKIEQLQKLCRQLQVDRAAFLRLLKNHNITPTSQICMDERDKPSCNGAGKKVVAPKKPATDKEKELERLKTQMKAFQDELHNAENILPLLEAEAAANQLPGSHASDAKIDRDAIVVDIVKNLIEEVHLMDLRRDELAKEN